MSFKWSIPALMVARTALPITYLLDTYTGAQVAYSLRKLKTGITNCIRVRRSSDDAEQDIGFVAGILDASSLTTFVGSNDGFIIKWYDQSGNGLDATQSTLTVQPQIVSSGTIITSNGKYAAQFDGGDYLGTPSSANYTAVGGEWSAFGVCKFDDGAARLLWDSDDNGTPKRLAQFLRNGGSSAVQSIAFDNAGNPFTDSAGDPSTNQVLLFAIRTATTIEIYLNDTSDGSTGTTGTPATFTTVANIGSFNSGTSNFMKGYVQELIHYGSTADYRVGASININNYYAIY